MKKTEKKGNHLAVKMAIAMVLGLIGVQRKQSAVNLVVYRSEQHDQRILNQRTGAGGGVLSGSDGVGHQRPGFQGDRFKEAAAGDR